jgi:hypothetical protein
LAAQAALTTSTRPALGGSGGYAKWFCEEQLQKFHAGEAVDVSLSFVYRWSHCIQPYCKTNNRERPQIIGADLLNPVTFITAWPNATLNMMAAYIFNKGGDLYSHQTIFKCLKELDITKKRALTESFQAQRPDVQVKIIAF